MEPRIQYAQTEDGVSIAYYKMGEGPPLVWMPTIPTTHLEFEWRIPELRQAYDAMAGFSTLIRFDSRGFGLSDREVTDFSVDAMMRDLEAVTDHLGLGKFQLVGLGWEGSVAIAYAARHPERVSHLVLWHAPAQGSDVSEQYYDLAALAEKDWEMASEAWIRATLAWIEGDLPRQAAALMRESANPDTLMSYMKQLRERDVSDLLPQLSVPTLLIHRRRYRLPPVEASRRIAAAIPDARLLLLEGSSYGMGADGLAAILAFLREDEAPAQQALELPQGTAIILFADIADSTALTTKLGDAVYREKERELDATLRDAITEAGGTPVEGKVLGDGVMAVFTSARQAIDAAQRCRDLGNEAGLPLHLGIHAGDVVREGNNVHGGAVQVASRVQSSAEPGEILVSATVRDLARTSAGVQFEDRGEHDLKGIDEPQRLFEVRERES